MMSVPAGWNGSSIDAGWYLNVIRFARDTAWLHSVAALYTTYGVALFALLLAAGWWAARRSGVVAMGAALWAPISAVLAYPLNDVIKMVVVEPRPCRALPAVVTVLPCPPPGDYSFPSNHTVVAAAVAVALLGVHRRLALLAGMLAVLMALSRVYVGVHYPHDVLAGLVLGALVGATGLLGRHALARPVERLRGSCWRPLAWVVAAGSIGHGPGRVQPHHRTPRSGGEDGDGAGQLGHDRVGDPG